MRLIKKIINRGVIIFKKISIGDSLAITPIMVSNNSYSPDSKTVAGCEGGNGSGELSPRWCSIQFINNTIIIIHMLFESIGRKITYNNK